MRSDSTAGTTTVLSSATTSAVSPGLMSLTNTCSELVAAGYSYYARFTPNSAVAGDSVFDFEVTSTGF